MSAQYQTRPEDGRSLSSPGAGSPSGTGQPQRPIAEGTGQRAIVPALTSRTRVTSPADLEARGPEHDLPEGGLLAAKGSRKPLVTARTVAGPPLCDLPLSATETAQDETCGICKRPGRLAPSGCGHAVLFARVTPFDFHRYAPSRHMAALYALRKEAGL